MFRFQEHLDTNLIAESLDSAAEFYVTDDTIAPKQIYASVSVNGSDYGMSLVETTYDKVYALELYRIVSVKRRNWTFKTQSDIRTVLSTLLKFVEYCYPIVKNRMHGIIIEIPGKSGSERYEKLISRIIKKTYIQTFRVVPVKKTTEKASNFVFIVKKTVMPESIFKTAAFKKHFDFDPKGMPVAEIATSENLEKMIEPYRTQKKSVSLKPSKKYAFGKIELGNEIDSEDLGIIDDISSKVVKDDDGDASGGAVADLLKKKTYINLVDRYKNGDEISLNNFPIPIMFLSTDALVKSLREIFKYPDVSTEKLLDDKQTMTKIKNFVKFVYTDNLTQATRQAFPLTGLVNESGLMLGSGKNKKRWIGIFDDTRKKLDLDNFSTKDNLQVQIDAEAERRKDPTPSKEKKFFIPIAYAKKLELPIKLESDNPAFARDNIAAWDNTRSGSSFSFDVGDAPGSKKLEAKKESLKSPSYNSWLGRMEKFKTNPSSDDPTEKKNHAGFKSMRSYSGKGYVEINTSLRAALSAKENNFITKQTKNFIDFFIDHSFELESGIWVYRNADIPGRENYSPGDVFLDPAFLSTSLSSGIGINDSAFVTEMKIFLPKGTKCLPILDFSRVPREAEILLAPFSRIKMTEVYKQENTTYRHMKEHKFGRVFMVGTYTGNGLESFYQAYNDNKVLDLLKEEESKKKPKDEKNSGHAWNDPTISYEDMQKLAGSKKIKIEM